MMETINKIFSVFNPTFNISLYATTNVAIDRRNINIESKGLVSFIFSFFFDALSISINLYLEIVL